MEQNGAPEQREAHGAPWSRMARRSTLLTPSSQYGSGHLLKKVLACGTAVAPITQTSKVHSRAKPHHSFFGGIEFSPTSIERNANVHHAVPLGLLSSLPLVLLHLFLQRKQ